MTYQEIIQNKKLTDLFLGINLIYDPNEIIRLPDPHFEFSILNIFGQYNYQFVAKVNNHILFPNSIRNGQFIVELLPEIKDKLFQKILLTIELDKDFNLPELYENLVFEIKRFGLNTKIETMQNENKEVIFDSIAYLSSPEESPLHIGFSYSLESEEMNHFVVELVRVFNKEKFNSFLKERGINTLQKKRHITLVDHQQRQLHNQRCPYI
jgi:hypothetical protein